MEFTKGWRKLHNKELHDFYSSPNISRIFNLGRMRWVEHMARMVEITGRPFRRRGNIKMELKEIELEVVEWISLTQEREKWHGDTFLGYMKSGEP